MSGAVTSAGTQAGKVRLGGLTSGMDTQSIVTQLLAVERQQVDNLKQTKEIEEAKIQTWNDVASQLQTFAQTISQLKSDGTTGYTLFDNKTTVIGDESVISASVTSAAVPATYMVQVVRLATPSVAYGAQKAVGYTLPTGGTIHLNGTPITLTAGQSLNQIAQTITSAPYASGEEVIATLIDNHLVLQTKNMGATALLQSTVNGAHPFTNATDDPDGLLQNELGLIDVNGDLVNSAQTGVDSVFLVNNINLTHNSNVVSDVIPGMTLNLINAGTSTMQVTPDTKGVKDIIKTFVNSYNETRDLIDRTRNAKINEDDRFGLLFSDSLLKDLFNNLRQLTTGGIRLGGSMWSGTLTSSGAAANSSTLPVSGFTTASGTLNAGDSFMISGQPTVYTVQSNATVAANATTLSISPPLTDLVAGGTAINVLTRTLEDIGVGVRNDTVSGVDGILGLLDEGKLDTLLESNLSLVKNLFTRSDTTKGSEGVARRLYDWIDAQTRISFIQGKQRNIDNIKIDGLGQKITRISEQVKRLEARLQTKEDSLLRKFSEMESSIARSQSAGNAIAGLANQG